MSAKFPDGSPPSKPTVKIFTSRSISFWGALLLLLLAGATSVDAQWVISGRVVGPQLEPLAGYDLDLLDSLGNPITLNGDVSAPDGTFAFSTPAGLVPDFYTIQIQPPLGSSYFPGEFGNLFLAASENIGDLTLASGSRYTGRVIDEQGLGIPNIDLNFFVASTATPVVFSGDSTAADGTFSLLVLPDVYDIEFRTTLTTPGGPYIPVTLSDVPLTSNLDAGDITFFDGHLLEGIVVEVGTGNPVANADLDVRDPITGDALETPGDNTDLAGVFSFFAPAGLWEIEVDPPLGATLVAKFVTTTITPGVVNNIGTIELPEGVTVSGTTVNNGTPVPEVDLDFEISATQVEIATAHDNANGSGVFSVQVEPDTYDIQFRPPFATGLAPIELTDQVITTNVNLGPVELPVGNALTGVVTAGIALIEGVEVTLADAVTGDPVYTFGNDTDITGFYAIRQVPGVYDVTFTSILNPGLGSVTITNVDLSTDQVLDVDLAAMPSPTFLRGDTDLSGTLNIADVIRLLEILFQGGALGMTCEDALDVNDSGIANIADAIYLLSYLFGGGPDPAAPFPTAGVDPTPDLLAPCP